MEKDADMAGYVTGSGADDPDMNGCMGECMAGSADEVVDVHGYVAEGEDTADMVFAGTKEEITKKIYNKLQTVLFQLSGPHQCIADARMEEKSYGHLK